MKPTLQPGLTLTRSIVIDEPRTIAFMGQGLRIYATPSVLSDIEFTCRDLILAHLDPGEDSVGVSANFDHTAATPIGMTVTITVSIASVEGRRITLDVLSRDEFDQVAKGQHVRFVVETAKSKQRLEAKVAKWRAAG